MKTQFFIFFMFIFGVANAQVTETQLERFAEIMRAQKSIMGVTLGNDTAMTVEAFSPTRWEYSRLGSGYDIPEIKVFNTGPLWDMYTNKAFVVLATDGVYFFTMQREIHTVAGETRQTMVENILCIDKIGEPRLMKRRYSGQLFSSLMWEETWTPKGSYHAKGFGDTPLKKRSPRMNQWEKDAYERICKLIKFIIGDTYQKSTNLSLWESFIQTDLFNWDWEKRKMEGCKWNLSTLDLYKYHFYFRENDVHTYILFFPLKGEIHVGTRVFLKSPTRSVEQDTKNRFSVQIEPNPDFDPNRDIKMEEITGAKRQALINDLVKNF